MANFVYTDLALLALCKIALLLLFATSKVLKHQLTDSTDMTDSIHLLKH